MAGVVRRASLEGTEGSEGPKGPKGEGQGPVLPDEAGVTDLPVINAAPSLDTPSIPLSPLRPSASPNAISSSALRPPGHKPDESFARLPDLLIIDGGKGQLGVAVEVLKAFGLFGRVPVCGLAKQQEEIFLPGQPVPILLPRRSQALYLVQRVRDEAHRFALSRHRVRRGKLGLASQLDAIPGIGPARRKALLRRFGSLDGIREAGVDELVNVRGMTRAAAEALKANL